MQGKMITSRTTVAGILNLIVASFILFVILGEAIATVFLRGTSWWWWNQIVTNGEISELIVGILIAVAVFLTLVGILSLLGGIAALQRKWWGLALAGSIASIFGFALLGIPAIIFTIVSKNEFS
jgi:hypothetical protein